MESLCTASSKSGEWMLLKNVFLHVWNTFPCCVFAREKAYHLGFVDLVRFNPQGKIAQMKGFLNNGYIQKYVEQHEDAIGQGMVIAVLLTAATTFRGWEIYLEFLNGLFPRTVHTLSISSCEPQRPRRIWTFV